MLHILCHITFLKARELKFSRLFVQLDALPHTQNLEISGSFCSKFVTK
jgi:hypothetical protein